MSAVQALEAARPHARGEKRRRDIIGQVRAENRPQPREMLCRERAQVHLHRVALNEREVVEARHRLRQHRQQPPVELDRDDPPRTLRELLRQRADAGADLQHAHPRVRAGGVGNLRGHPALDEKVLPHGLGKMEAVPRQKRLNIAAVTEIHGKNTPFGMRLVQYTTFSPCGKGVDSGFRRC